MKYLIAKLNELNPRRPRNTSKARRRHRHLQPILSLLLAAGLAVIGAQSSSGAPGTFSNTGSLATARYDYTATLLPSGKVLAAGGFNNLSGALASAELYNPATGSWIATGSLAAMRNSHTATLLPSGKVLVVGGANSSGSLVSAELYDPATGSWSATGSLATARDLHTATLLPNGKVLVAGGESGSIIAIASAELYDPATGSWSTTGSLATARSGQTATLLPSGKVLVAAGFDTLRHSLSSAELYNPATGSWSATGRLAIGRAGHIGILLPSGKVLVAGGHNTSMGDVASAELYNPATGSWSATGNLATARELHTATLLSSGQVLVAGGVNPNGFLVSAELYDPATGSWSATGNLATARAYHTATLLPSGKVLVAGGEDGGLALASAELYDPPVVAAQLLNISTRLKVLTNDNVLIGGFIITGSDSKKVIVRAIGPSLTKAGIVGALADPILELHKPDGTVVTNDNWKGTQEAAIIATGVAPKNDLESAIVATLVPGNYTAIVHGKNNGTGIGLVEAFDLNQAASSELANISTRGFVDTGDNVMIGGFIIGGGTAGTNATVLVRAIGPSLTKAGVAGALQDPKLELHDANGNLLKSNDNWKSTQKAAIIASGVAPTNDKESAIIDTLAPGNYTAIVRGKNSTTGVALVEVYNLP